MHEPGLAGLGDKVVPRSRRGRAHDVRETHEVALRSGRLVPQIKQSSQPVESVVERRTFHLEFVAVLPDVVVQRATDELQRQVGRKSARAIRRYRWDTVNGDGVRQVRVAKAENVDELDRAGVKISTVRNAKPAVVREIRGRGLDHER